MIQRTKGILFWKKVWGSPCSIHRGKKEGCHICDAGYYTNVWGLKINQLLYKLSPSLWKWYMNRPNSSARERLTKIFPNLKSK